MTALLQDTDRSCTVCGGLGLIRTERTGARTFTEPCWRCAGTGANGILIFKPTETPE